MLGLGATTQLDEFKKQVHNWPAPLIGFICQVGVMPLLAFGAAHAFDLSDPIALSIVAIGSTPGGSTSNLFTKWSRGDLPLSITMTVISTVLSFGTLPGLLALYGSSFTNDSFQIPFVSILQSLLLVVIPVAVGVTVRYFSAYWALWCERVGSACGVLFIVAAIIVGSVTEKSIWNAPAGSYVVGALLLLVGACLGYLLAWLFKFPRRQCRTIALETGIQNSTLTITVLTLSFPVDDNDPESKVFLEELLQFPLLYSLFLVIDSLICTGMFHYLAQFDPEEEQAEARLEEKKREEALEREMNGGKTNAELEEEKAMDVEPGDLADTPTIVKGGDSDGKELSPNAGGASEGGHTPIAHSNSGVAPNSLDSLKPEEV